MSNAIIPPRFPRETGAMPQNIWGNEFGGNTERPVLTDFVVVGYDGHDLWLRSKTGDSSDSIVIRFVTDPHNFSRIFLGKKASFSATTEWDYKTQTWVYQWTCTKLV